MRVRDGSGASAVLVIYVPPDSGTVRASLGDVAIELEAEDVSKLCLLYRHGQAVALEERGGW